MKKTSKKVIAVTLSASMLLGGSMTAMAATTNPDISQREIDHKTAAKNIAAQGMVLMENKNNSLPISAKKGTKVALFGQMTQHMTVVKSRHSTRLNLIINSREYVCQPVIQPSPNIRQRQ